MLYSGLTLLKFWEISEMQDNSYHALKYISLLLLIDIAIISQIFRKVPSVFLINSK